MSPPQVSVVVGSFNRNRYLRATLASVRDELQDVPHEILVVDGGSTDRTLPWLIRQKDVVTIVQHNRGTWRGRAVPRRSWGYFMNLAFKAAQADAVCMLSDDCLVVPGAIRNGLSTFAGAARSGPIGGVAFWWRNWPVDATYRVGRTFGNRLFVNHGLFSREALENVGFVDEDAFSFYHADGDLGLRMDAAGYPCIVSDESFVEHHLEANLTVRASNLATQQRDWQTYRDRWEHLGEPERDWDERAHHDSADTVHRYWGRTATSPAVRRGTQMAFHARRVLRERLGN